MECSMDTDNEVDIAIMLSAIQGSGTTIYSVDYCLLISV